MGEREGESIDRKEVAVHLSGRLLVVELLRFGLRLIGSRDGRKVTPLG